MNDSLKISIVLAGRPAWRIAQEAGMSPTVLSRIVSGQRQASQKEKQALARVLEETIEELFGPSATETKEGAGAR